LHKTKILISLISFYVLLSVIKILFNRYILYLCKYIFVFNYLSLYFNKKRIIAHMLDYATLFCMFNLSLTFRAAWFSKNHKNAFNFVRLHLERCHPLFTQEDNYETSLKNYLSSFCYKGFIMEHFYLFSYLSHSFIALCWIILNEDQVIV